MVKKKHIGTRIEPGEYQDIKKLASLHDMTVSELLRYCYQQKKADLDLSEKHHQLKKQKEELKRKRRKICEEIENVNEKIKSVKARLENMDRREKQRKRKERESIEKSIDRLVRARRDGKTWEKIRHYASNQPCVQNKYIEQEVLVSKVEDCLRNIDKEARKANK